MLLLLKLTSEEYVAWEESLKKKIKDLKHETSEQNQELEALYKSRQKIAKENIKDLSEFCHLFGFESQGRKLRLQQAETQCQELILQKQNLFEECKVLEDDFIKLNCLLSKKQSAQQSIFEL